jgi:hypothetical protein
MQFLLNAQELSMPTARDLRQCLEQVRQRQFSEVWLIAGDDGPSLTMLINGASAWLMNLQNQDDVGFNSLNPSYHGPAELRMEFQLSNGQMDEYPVAWTLALEDAFDACEYFVTTQGGRSPAITWEDS